MKNNDIRKQIALGSLGLILILLLTGIFVFTFILQVQPELSQPQNNPQIKIPEKPIMDDLVEDGVHVATGLIEGEGLMMVVANCTNCHSAKLVTQNRFTKEGWIKVIRWMQETQGLWDLGENEEAIVSYLSTHYAPEIRGRRKPLEVEWYSLEEKD